MLQDLILLMDKKTIEQLKMIGAVFSDFVVNNYDCLIERAIAYWKIQSQQFDISLYQPTKEEYGEIDISKTGLIFNYSNSYDNTKEYFYMSFDLLDDEKFGLWVEKHE